MIDEIDQKILTILQEKARIPNAEVARQVGMAPSAVLERIRKLEERQIIEGYEVRLNPLAFRQGLTAFVEVHGIFPDFNQAISNLEAIPCIQDIHYITGNDCILIKVRVSDNQELGHIVSHQISHLPGVTSTKTQVVLNTFKESRKINLSSIEN